MKNRMTLLIAVLVVLVLAAYMFCYQVRYDHVAVKTTFERAVPPAYNSDGTLARNAAGELASPGSIVEKPGLGLKWPWPIQSVYQYSKQIQVFDAPPEEIQTSDHNNLIVKTYLAWRIQDPHAFFVSVKTPEEAEKKLQPLLAEVRSVFGGYRFDQLVNTDPKQIKLADIEREALETLRKRLAAIKTNNQTGFGIVVEHLGVRRIVLPERVTESVFNRMKATRERLASDARATGSAKAAAIKSEAVSAQNTILSFAQSRADAIRAEGIRQAAASYKVYDQDPAFEIFLAQLDALKKMLAHNTTFVLDSTGPLSLFNKEPGAANPATPATPAAAKP